MRRLIETTRPTAGSMRCAVATLLAALVVLAAPSSAGAHQAWIVNSADETVSVFDVEANAIVGTPIAVGADPRSIAISPDGKTAYVANNGDHTVSVLSTVTRTEVAAPIDLGTFEPTALAMSPDGSRLYVGGFSGVRAIDTATRLPIGTRWALDAAPPGVADLAVMPDGTHAWAALDFDGTIADFDLRSFTGHEVADTRSDRLKVTNGGSALDEVAVRPNGSLVVVAGIKVGRIKPATRSVATDDLPDQIKGLAITPNGAKALATGNMALWRLGLPNGRFESEFSSIVESTGEDVAVTPDGELGVVAGGEVGNYRVRSFDPITQAPFAPAVAIPGDPISIAIVPNQPPVATLVAQDPGAPGGTVSFDAGGSTDPEGWVARYDWDFGDGTTLPDDAPQVTHVYARPGTFHATVTVTDNEGCSKNRVFTGQTASCNGDARAVATRTIVVPAPPDTTPPVVKITGTPGKKTHDRTPAFRFSADEPADFDCRIDNKPYKPCTSPYTAKRLDKGRHKFTVRATDRAGNQGRAVTTGFRITAKR